MGLFSSNNDIFRTQADTRFNSFSEPLNGVNTNQGNWGVDPSYLTPAYLSPFRPQYQGPSGPSYGAFRPSWGTSVNQVMNPFARGGSNYGGNYWQQTTPYYDAMFHKPMDGMASFTQNWVAPAATSWASYRYLGDASSAVGKALGGGLTKGALSGLGVGTELAATGVGWGTWLGGAAAGIALPTIAAQVAMSGVDAAVFDPYIGQRRTSNSLRDNFAGVTFGEGTGDRFTGGGISRRYAANIAKQVSKAGAMDMTFNQNEVSLLTDYASRSGLMDNVNSTQMASRFEGILKQVKVVMSIANTSDFRETIEIMSKMQMAGVGSTQLAGVMGRLGASAGSAGQSFQKLFNTVGAQGQYLFGGQGLTPYVGHIAAFDAAASMNAAYRSGLLSPAMMARMGGVEGASQSAVGAQIASYSTPYSTFQGYNAYMGKGETGNVTSNVANFGASMASGNPLENIGRFMMSKNALVSRQIEDRGVYGEQDQIYQLAKQLPGGLKTNGKVDSGVAFMIMTNMMGMTPDMAHAKLAQISAYGDNQAVSQMLEGNQRASMDAILKYQQQEGLDKGIFTSPYNAVKRGAMHVQKWGAGAVGSVTEAIGGVADSFQNWTNEAFFGVKPGDLESQYFNRTSYGQVNVDKDLGRMSGTVSGSTKKDLGIINKLAKSGQKDALTLLDPKSSDLDKKNALYRLKGTAGLKGDYSNSEDQTTLLHAMDKMGVSQVDGNVESGKVRDKLVSDLQGMGGGNTLDGNIEYINLMSKVMEGNHDEGTRRRIAELSGKDISSLDDATLDQMAGDTMTKVGANGLENIIGLGKVGNAEGLEAAINKERGGIARGPIVKSSGDTKALYTQIKTQMGMSKARADIRRNVEEGRIDMATGYAAINALDNKETTGKFKDAVDTFAKAVGAMNGDKSGKSDKEAPATNWNHYFGRGRDVPTTK